MEEEGGLRRLVWLPKEVDETVRLVAEALGMSVSGFIRYCVLQYFETHNIHSARIERAWEERGDAKPSGGS